MVTAACVGILFAPSSSNEIYSTTARQRPPTSPHKRMDRIKERPTGNPSTEISLRRHMPYLARRAHRFLRFRFNTTAMEPRLRQGAAKPASINLILFSGIWVISNLTQTSSWIQYRLIWFGVYFVTSCSLLQSSFRFRPIFALTFPGSGGKRCSEKLWECDQASGQQTVAIQKHSLCRVGRHVSQWIQIIRALQNYNRSNTKITKMMYSYQ
jgi:hypothetical protein